MFIVKDTFHPLAREKGTERVFLVESIKINSPS